MLAADFASIGIIKCKGNKKCHSTPIRVAKIKNSATIKAVGDKNRTRLLCIAGRVQHGTTTLKKTDWQFLKKTHTKPQRVNCT